MRTYEEALSIWGARKLGIDESIPTEVTFAFDVQVFEGCETCGPDVEKLFEATIRPEGGPSKFVTIGTDYNMDFGDVVREILLISAEVE